MEKIALKIKYIGFYQLVGGIIGILNTIRFLPNFTQINGGIFLILLLIFALYSYSIFCGYLLIKMRNIKGLNLSIYNQLIQIIGFGVLGFAFHFTAGIYAGIKLNLTHDTILTFMFGHSAAMININSNPEFTELSLNVIALILLNLILNLKSKFEKIEKVQI
jgi:hypothetical protein